MRYALLTQHLCLNAYTRLAVIRHLVPYLNPSSYCFLILNDILFSDLLEKNSVEGAFFKKDSSSWVLLCKPRYSFNRIFLDVYQNVFMKLERLQNFMDYQKIMNLKSTEIYFLI